MGGLTRHMFLWAHVGALIGGAAWLMLALPAAIGVAPLAVVAASALYILWLERPAGRAITLMTYPAELFALDLVAAALWMIATAPNPRSIAFVVVVLVGAVGVPRFGRGVLVPVLATYVVGRVGQELYRVDLGMPTPLGALAAEAAVLAGAAVVFVGALTTYRTERDRAATALRRVSDLERLARDLASTTEPDAVLRAIPANALAIVEADYAAIVLRRGDQFEVAAGAGLAERVVGMRRSSREGVFGDVLRRRAAVVRSDYSRHETAVASVVELGIRTLVGIPIFVAGEMAACLTLGRVGSRAFAPDELAAIDGLAAHASIALRNARHLEQALRLDDLARAAMNASPEEVLLRVVEGALAAFGVDIALVARTAGGQLEIVAAAGAAVATRGVKGPLGPVLQQAVRTGELVAIDDYPRARASLSAPESPQFFDEVGGRAAILAPIREGTEVVAVLVVGTTDPYRTFDRVDRQTVAAFAESARAALRAAEGRRIQQRHIERLSILNQLAVDLALVHEPVEIARLAWQVAGRLVPHDAFYVAQYDEARHVFEFVFHEDQGTVDTERLTLPLGDGPSSHAVRTGEPYVVRTGGDAPAHPGKTFGDVARRSASAVHVPLRVGHRVVGVLSAQSYTPNTYDDEHVAILGSLGTLIASSFENASLIARTRDLYLASVRALAAAVDARDPYTRSHSARVASLSRTIAEEMGLSADDTRRVQIGALLHDIGKIGIPDAILNKPGPLTDEEWVIMRTHPALGGAIVSSVEPLAELAPVIRCHHERYDGAGYPDRLAGDAIPLASYIVAAADAYEVIVSRRSYKEAQSVDQAVAELLRCRGTQFHPAVVDAFVRVVERDRAQGTQYLSRVSAIEHEEIENVPGPGDVLERLAESTRTHARQLAILQRIAGEITSVLDLDELADRLLRIVSEAMGYENGFLCTLDDERGDALTVRAAVGPSAGYVGQELARGQGISWHVMEHGRLQNVPDVQADGRFIGPDTIRSSLIVPLRIGDESVGVLGIESPRPAAFHADDEALLTAVSHQVAAAVRVARLHRAAQHAASTDPLTGLPNRRVFFQRLEGALPAVSEGTPVTVALVDVDLLKQVNDRFGHGTGDEALQSVARILGAGVREQDVVARLGGDEFGILFCGAPILVAERIMRRLAETVRATPLTGTEHLPSISWGLAEGVAGAGVDALIDSADRAMYRHKRRAHLRLNA